MELLLLVIAVIIIGNLFLIFSRNKKKQKSAKKIKLDYLASLKQHEDLKRRLTREQENAAIHVERRNKTLELYDQVRKQAEESKKEDTDA